MPPTIDYRWYINFWYPAFYLQKHILVGQLGNLQRRRAEIKHAWVWILVYLW